MSEAEAEAEALADAFFAGVFKIGQAAVRGRGKKTTTLATAVMEVFDGFDGSMSTRQVYYQLVSRGDVENRPAEYDRVQRLLVAMRRSGEISYDRVVDRTRGKHQRPGWNGVENIMSAVATQYRRDLWAEQDCVCMVACEKQALEGIFAETVDKYGASLWVARGFASESFTYEWATEICRLNNEGHGVVIAYFGDFDPSGLSIDVDTQDKLRQHGAKFEWAREGLLEQDLDAFDLVNIPVKASDSRSRKHVEKYGNRAAELDALHPNELRKRIEQAIRCCIQTDAWDRLEHTESVERQSLRVVTANWDKALQAARGAA